MHIFDGHCDVLLKHYYQRHFRNKQNFQISFQTLKEGGVKFQVCALYLPTPLRHSLDPIVDMYSLFLEILQKEPSFHWVKNLSDLHLVQKNPEKIGLLLSLEGAEPLSNRLERLDFFHHLSITLITLTWSRRNDFADGTSFDPSMETSYGLTPLGRKLIQRMNQLSMVVDVSHLNERGFWDVLEISEKPVVASHSCVHKLAPHTRNLKDDQIRKLAEIHGLIGINFYPTFLTGSSQASVADIVKHIQYISDLTGSTENIALGSDFDGIETSPEDLSSPKYFDNLREALAKAGFSSEDQEKILWKNWFRIFESHLS
ncbi:MAG: membrane dipeptidase [Planctomycetota bacterium]|nr:MAG: membrane dipeptidase [Planctomycetota bacterium]